MKKFSLSFLPTSRRSILISLVTAVLPLCTLKAKPFVMHNLDGDVSFIGDTPAESEQLLQKTVRDVRRCGADALVYSIGAGSDILYYPTKIGSLWGWRKTTYDDTPAYKTRIARIKAAQSAGLDAPWIAGTQAGKSGMQFYLSYRMNDNHYCADPENHPLTGKFWIDNKELSLGKTAIPGVESFKYLLDYAHEKVRAYRLGIINEAIERYSSLMDGFELDFSRFPMFFRPGEAASNAPLMTALVAQVKKKLNEAVQKEGRTMSLVVRVPPAIHNCTWAGLEIKKWITDGIVDIVIPTQVLALTFDLPLDEFVAAAKGTNCKIFGCILGRTAYVWPFTDQHDNKEYTAKTNRSPTSAQMIGAARNQLALGAVGIQYFNTGIYRDNPAELTKITSAIIDAKSFARADRRYIITYPYYRDRLDTYEYRKQLPAILKDGKPASLRLLVGENLAAARADLRYIGFRLGLHGAGRHYSGLWIKVEINGKVLHEGKADDFLALPTGKIVGTSALPATEAYLQWSISTPSILLEGWNAITITMRNLGSLDSLQLVETEVGALAAQNPAKPQTP